MLSVGPSLIQSMMLWAWGRQGCRWQAGVVRSPPVTVRRRDGFQRHLLEEEGVSFGPAGRVDLARFLWQPGKKRKR